ncbi:MAG: disulfide bond formation protein B [Maritimibacter sp.]|nr:disulfide bond formation protein B [Maritimibacter sp.]MCB1357844.1 disulfide bond formation protein B [Maritimibacter sp.]
MLTRRTLIFVAWAFSTLSIAGAWTFQLLGYAPCQLCYWQRGPHYAIIVIGFIALAARWYWLAWVGAVLAAATSAIGFYHSGVERHWWPGPASCTGSGVSGLSTEDLVGQLTQAPLVRCDEIPWRMSDAIPLELLDITMANLNAIGSLVFVFVWIAAARMRD